MIFFPNCKINLGLSITQKRADGFHDIESVFVPVMLQDAIEFIPSTELTFTSDGMHIPGNLDDNIILKAYHLLKKDFPQIPNLQIHLLKNIPTGAGLGGGSADATFMLKAMNDYFKLAISQSKLSTYALQLGSDCPFFINNKICISKGRGEILTPLDLDLSTYTIVMIKPDVHINTAWAFTQIKPQVPAKSPWDILSQPIATWANELINDFEKPIFEAHPQLKEIKNILYEQGALYASMSGSGSVIYGLFPKNEKGANTFHDNMKKAFAPNKVYISTIL